MSSARFATNETRLVERRCKIQIDRSRKTSLLRNRASLLPHRVPQANRVTIPTLEAPFLPPSHFSQSEDLPAIRFHCLSVIHRSPLLPCDFAPEGGPDYGFPAFSRPSDRCWSSGRRALRTADFSGLWLGNLNVFSSFLFMHSHYREPRGMSKFHMTSMCLTGHIM
jgi:hypothetical protein